MPRWNQLNGAAARSGVTRFSAAGAVKFGSDARREQKAGDPPHEQGLAYGLVFEQDGKVLLAYGCRGHFDAP